MEYQIIIPEGKRQRKAVLNLKKGLCVKRSRYDVVNVTILTQENSKDFIGSAAAGAAAGLLLGPVGLLAGALVGGNTRQTTMVFDCTDGTKLFGTVKTRDVGGIFHLVEELKKRNNPILANGQNIHSAKEGQTVLPGALLENHHRASGKKEWKTILSDILLSIVFVFFLLLGLGELTVDWTAGICFILCGSLALPSVRLRVANTFPGKLNVSGLAMLFFGVAGLLLAMKAADQEFTSQPTVVASTLSSGIAPSIRQKKDQEAASLGHKYDKVSDESLKKPPEPVDAKVAAQNAARSAATAKAAEYAMEDTKDNQYTLLAAAEGAVKDILKDPDSVQFRNESYHRTGNVRVACGEVNAKNGFGGYAGFTHFVSMGITQATFFENQTDDFAKVWNKFCR